MHHTKSHPIIAVKQHRTVFIEHGAGIPIVEFVCLRKKIYHDKKKKKRKSIGTFRIHVFNVQKIK